MYCCRVHNGRLFFLALAPFWTKEVTPGQSIFLRASRVRRGFSNPDHPGPSGIKVQVGTGWFWIVYVNPGLVRLGLNVINVIEICSVYSKSKNYRYNDNMKSKSTCFEIDYTLQCYHIKQIYWKKVSHHCYYIIVYSTFDEYSIDILFGFDHRIPWTY